MNCHKSGWSFLTCLLLMGCAGVSPLARDSGGKADSESVRRVDFGQVPEVKELAARARRLGNDMYPKVVNVLVEDASGIPSQFDIVFRKNAPLDFPAVTRGTTIYVGTHWFFKGSDNLRDFDSILVHEMGHVAEQYRAKAPFYWTEGMADYARFKLGYTNGWSCPECAEDYSHYTSGYGCAGSLLLYLDGMYGAGVVRQLNSALHRSSYAEDFFLKATGKPLAVLWTEFQKTPAYKPIAVGVHELQQSLGYVNGRPPKDIDARFKAYVQNQPGGSLTLQGAKFLEGLRNKGQLPGFSRRERIWMYQGQKGQMPYRLTKKGVDPAGYPAVRYFCFYKTTDDPSAYQYVIERASGDSPWTLRKAWRTAHDGQLMENYSVPTQRNEMRRDRRELEFDFH